MTNFEALFVIFGVQHFRHAGKPKDGDFYAPGYFCNPSRSFLTGLLTENRRVSLRLARQMACLRCNNPLSENGTGDHMIALAVGGPNGAHNYLPLCGRCNSTKGIKDFIRWWLDCGGSAADIPADALCAYARLMFAWLGDKLPMPAPEYLERAACELLSSLPSPAHSAALLDRARADAAEYLSEVSA